MKTDAVSGLVSLAATVVLYATGLSEVLALYMFLALVAAPTVGLGLVVIGAMMRPRCVAEVA